MLDFEFLTIDRRRKESLRQQVYEEIRDAVLSGRLVSGTKLASSRNLVEQIGVSRTTVLGALDQLIAEGFLTTRAGSGTFVSAEIPTEPNFPRGTPVKLGVIKTMDGQTLLAKNTPFISDGDPQLSGTSKRMATIPKLLHPELDLNPLRPGIPALDEFPFDVWAQLWRKGWKQLKPHELSYRDPSGCPRLRKLIANYVATKRGVRCTEDQIFIVSGTVQAIDLISRLFVDPGDTVYCENPGYLPTRQVLSSFGANLKPVSVDQRGTVVPTTHRASKKTKLAVLTPSRQFPLGVTMSIERRIDWISWARKNNCLVIEDDYDSEFRYSQKPVPSMQGLDEFERTIYVGSFSKVVFPALSMAYVVVPQRYCKLFSRACELITRPPSAVDQMALVEFIKHGYFIRHLRRMRRTHKLRRDAFVCAVNDFLSDKIRLVGSDAGLHCTAEFLHPNGKSDVAVSKRLQGIGISSCPLSPHFFPGTPGKQITQGLLLGFAVSHPRVTANALKRLKQLL